MPCNSESNTTFVAPRQNVKLRQYSGVEPTIRDDLAHEPAQATHKVIKIRLVGKRSAGGNQRRFIAYL